MATNNFTRAEEKGRLWTIIGIVVLLLGIIIGGPLYFPLSTAITVGTVLLVYYIVMITKKRKVSWLFICFAGIVILWCLYRWWPVSDKGKPNIPSIADTLQSKTNTNQKGTADVDYLKYGESLVPGKEHTFDYQETVYFVPTRPGIVHVKCWDDKGCSFEMKSQLTDDGKIYDSMFNSTPNRYTGLYKVIIVASKPEYISAIYTNKKQ